MDVLEGDFQGHIRLQMMQYVCTSLWGTCTLAFFLLSFLQGVWGSACSDQPCEEFVVPKVALCLMMQLPLPLLEESLPQRSYHSSLPPSTQVTPGSSGSLVALTTVRDRIGPSL